MHQRNYDFIVIGGGLAGCLMARRLIESHCGKVALIEAGDTGGTGRSDVRTVVPAFYPRTFGTSLDWGFSTVPQGGLSGRRIAWPRGKTLGGSGAINAMIYLQASQSDFNRWAQAGCSGWDWPAIENFLATLSHSSKLCPVSELCVNELSAPHPWSLRFMEACVEFGLSQQEAWNQSIPNTCGLYSLTQRNGRRHHTGLQLLDILPTSSFDLYRGYTVQNLQLVSDKVAKVRMLDCENRVIELRSEGEVVLCAGAIGTPEILLRSGIGPADSLRALGVGVVRDLPGVGENLQDHLVYPLVYQTKVSGGLPSRFTIAQRKRYRSQEGDLHSNPLASNIAEAGALFSNNSFPPIASSRSADGTAGFLSGLGPIDPDFQIHFTPTHYLKYPSRSAPANCLSLTVNDLHPRSRGRVQLLDIHPRSAPLIDPAYLSHSEDLTRLIAAIETCREIARCRSLHSLIAEELLPGSKRTGLSSISRSIQTFSQSIYHPVGTCRMGIDANAVVDSNLRVRGCSNLHVADASILPDLPSANTQAVTLLVAARKAQWLTNHSHL